MRTMRRKKWLALLMAVLMVVSMLPVSAFAEDDPVNVPDASTFVVTADNTIEHGTVTMESNDGFAEGGTVELTVTPEEGYQLKNGSLKAFIGEDNYITPAQDEVDTAKYTFTMPASNVIIFAKFEESGLINQLAMKLGSPLGETPSAEGDVARVGEGESADGYTSLAEAIAAATDNQTVTLLKDCNEVIEKSITASITIDGGGNTMSGGMMLHGSNVLDVTVKNFNFTGTGLGIDSFDEVTVNGNTFTNITKANKVAKDSDGVDYEDAIIVQRSNKATITNNNIDGTNEAGIDCRDVANTVTITGNTVKNTQHNSVQIVWRKDDNKVKPVATVTGNTFENWGLGGEGRALRSRTNGLTFTGNVMKNSNAPEEFAKLEGSTTDNEHPIDASQNYWNGGDPSGNIGETETAYYIGIGEDKKSELKSYYSDAEMQDLVTLEQEVTSVGSYSDNLITEAVIENTNGVATAAGVTVHNVTWDDSENCAVFSGSESYLEIPSALTTLDTSKGFAVTSEVWIDNGNANWARVFDFNNGSTSKYFTANAGNASNASLRTMIKDASVSSSETQLNVVSPATYRETWVKLIWVVKADGSMCLYHDVFSDANLIAQCNGTATTQRFLADTVSYTKCLIGASIFGSGDGYFKGKMKSFSVHSPYSITATGSLTQGTLSVPEAAFSGEYVTVTGNMPEAVEDGVYRLDSITVTDADGGTVTANKTGVNTFAFVMPESDVTVTGTVAKHNFYNIISDLTGGTLICESRAAEGDPVSLAATAGEGTHLKSFTVTDADSNNVPVTDNTFVMPASNVTVTAEFEAHSYTVIADGKTFKYICNGAYCEQHTSPVATLTLSENGFALFEEKSAWKNAGLSLPAVSYYSGETLLEKKPTTAGSYAIKATIDNQTAVYPFTFAAAPSGYTTDENFRMAYKPISSSTYDFEGYVGDKWRQVTFSYGGFKSGTFKGIGITVSAAPQFVADGQAVLLTYTLTNNTASPVTNFRFYIAADTMIAGYDASHNEVDADNVVKMTNSSANVALFALSTTEGGTAVATEYYNATVSYCGVLNGADPSTVTPVASAGDSAFVMYFPLTTLQPGESAEYNFVIGMGSEETIQDIIKQVRAALGLVDYKSEKITGLDPNTTYIFEYEEEAEGKKEIEITSDDFGEIPLSGQDDQGQGYSFIGKNIKYKEKGSEEKQQELDIAGRPQTPSGSEILPGDEQYTRPEDVLVDTVTENSVKILPVKGQEYQYSTDNGTTWTAVPENGEITGLTSGSAIQIRTRIAATSESPASEYSEAVSVTLKPAVGNLNGFSAVGYTGFQDGQPHSITVTVPDGATVVYSGAADAEYTATNPAFTDPGEYTVYYRVTKEGCYPAYGSEKVVIENGFNMLGKALKGEALSDEDAKAVQNLFELTDDDNVRTIKLKVDFTADELSELLEIGTTKEIVLDLNGHVINGSKQGSVINVPSGAKLTLNDSSPNTEHAGYVDENGLWHLGSTVPEGCTAKTVKGGLLTGGQLGNGGGVVVNGTFNMNGGTIAGNKATHGGGVDVNGTFNMNGGTITGNYASILGGGVNANGTVNMYGGKIVGNGAATNGGGVCYNNGSLTLGGSANITGNTAASHPNNLWISYMEKGSSNCVAVAAGDNAPVTKGENKMSVGITLCSEGYNQIPQNYLAGRFTNGNNVTEAMKDCFFADNNASFDMAFNNNSTPDNPADDYLELVKIVKCTVTFDCNYHGTAPEPQIVIEGGKVTKPEDPTDTEYIFEGWYSSGQECTGEAWDFDSDTVTSNLTLYAKWTLAAAKVVTSDGTTTLYKSLADAVNAAKPGDTIYSIETSDSFTLPVGVKFVANQDYNGTVSAQEGYKIVVKNIDENTKEYESVEKIELEYETGNGNVTIQVESETASTPSEVTVSQEGLDNDKQTAAGKVQTALSGENKSNIVDLTEVVNNRLKQLDMTKVHTLATENEKENDLNSLLDAVKEAKKAGSKTVDMSMKMTTDINVAITDIKVEQNDKTKIETYTLDIQPVYSLTVESVIKETDKEDVKNTVTVAENAPLEVTETTNVSFPAPEGFNLTADDVLYVVHEKQNGEKYTYVADYDTETNMISFTNPHGFSEFSMVKSSGMVALNTTTGVFYDALNVALTDAETAAISEAPQTIQLLTDLTGDAKVGTVEVAPNVTLDLNGYDLEAKTVLAWGLVMNNRGSADGKLITAQDHFAYFGGKKMAASNENVMPVWDTTGGTNGYVFYAVSEIKHWAQTNNAGDPRYMFQPKSNGVQTVLGENSGVRVYVDFSYTQTDANNQTHQNHLTVEFGRSYLTQFLANHDENGMFVTLLGTEGVSNITAKSYLKAEKCNFSIESAEIDLSGKTSSN